MKEVSFFLHWQLEIKSLVASSLSFFPLSYIIVVCTYNSFFIFVIELF
jgi:hypothetical protein